MVLQLGKHRAIVESGELGTNCWHPRRFVKEGSRCDRIWTCNYPEKCRCMAIHAEIRHMKNEQLRLVRVSGTLDMRIEELADMLEK